MNAGILAADQTDVVLFLDDDVTPERGLVGAHAAAYAAHPDAWAVAGQVLQPGEEAADCSYRGSARGLLADLDFPFRSTHGSWVHNAMAGNLSVRRNKALQVGGFDENFVPPVAYRFETEFARRIERGGGKIWFEPRATLRHMRAADGGTRTAGGHLASASPSHGVGDYYYALVCGHGAERFLYWLRRPFREVMTRFHLCRPWWIPVKFVGELRAMAMALRLYRNGPRRLDAQKVKA
jgi:GT2 family glycosyltransferase